MGILTTMLKQTAVYWAPADPSTDAYGRPLFDDPVELNCRWEDVAMEYVARDGETSVSKSVVYVASDVVVGGLLMEGVIEDTEDSAFPDDPKDADGVEEIRRFDKLPNLKNTAYLRTAIL